MKLRENLLPKFLFLIFLSVTSFSFSSNIKSSNKWTLFKTFSGVRVEYKFQECQSEKVNNQVLILLKYTNETEATIDMSWATKIYRNNNCWNCNEIESQEHQKALRLEPGQTIKGDGKSKEDKRLYVFSHFIKLSPGMTKQKLTNFEFVNVKIVYSEN